MFFRREKTRELNFDDRLNALRQAGFKLESEGSGSARVSKFGCSVTMRDIPGTQPELGKAGFILGNEIGHLVNGGYQMFLLTPSGHKEPALASQLRALHDFQEDLKEALGLTSLYNQSLGTVSSEHLYDRVAFRDAGVPKRAWEEPLLPK